MSNILNKNLRFSLLAIAMLLNVALFGKQIPAKTDRLVNDFTNSTLSIQETRAMERKLAQYARETSTQIAVVIENSTDGEDIFGYSNRLAQQWGIGGKENDNGVLVYVAIQDRKIQIQTGYGAEGFLTDALSRRIIENVIAPAFRQGQYYVGLDRATSTIMDLGKGEYQGDQLNGRREAEGGIPLFLIIFVIFILVMLLSRYSDDDDDDGGYYRDGRYDTHPRRRRGGGWIIMPGGFGGGSSGGSGGFGGGGFGGGGFGGFGGGGFGGGGAGGSW
ncbi:MAG: YgcG family protein [Saprospiraceae bacterium]